MILACGLATYRLDPTSTSTTIRIHQTLPEETCFESCQGLCKAGRIAGRTTVLESLIHSSAAYYGRTLDQADIEPIFVISIRSTDVDIGLTISMHGLETSSLALGWIRGSKTMWVKNVLPCCTIASASTVSHYEHGRTSEPT